MEKCGRFVKWFQRFGSSEDLSGRVNYSNTITACYLFSLVHKPVSELSMGYLVAGPGKNWVRG